MAQPRRLGAEDSEVRARFVDAAEAILCDDGEHGLSARNVAARAGLKTQLLYYYFRTMDDLLLAVIHRVNERRLTSFEEALAAPEPLRAMWDSMVDPASSGLAAALASIAHYNEAVRDQIVGSARQFRALQTRVAAELLPEPVDPGASPAGIVMIAAALARMLVNEQALGLSEGHAEALAIVEQLLARFAPAAGDAASPRRD